MSTPIQEHPFVKRLQEHGHRLTPQRLAILRTLTAQRRHPSAQELFEALRDEYPTMSLATVYNTLSLFVNIGLVKEITVSGGGVRYDAADEPHLNLYCRKCRAIIDVPFAPLVELERTILETEGFAVDGSTIELPGICRRCRLEEPS